jgi:hypothetical protein
MVDLHSLPAGSRPDQAVRNNGPNDLALERFKLRELAEGWPCYRYAIDVYFDTEAIEMRVNGKILDLYSMKTRTFIPHGPAGS